MATTNGILNLQAQNDSSLLFEEDHFDFQWRKTVRPLRERPEMEFRISNSKIFDHSRISEPRNSKDQKQKPQFRPLTVSELAFSITIGIRTHNFEISLYLTLLARPQIRHKDLEKVTIVRGKITLIFSVLMHF